MPEQVKHDTAPWGGSRWSRQLRLSILNFIFIRVHSRFYFKRSIRIRDRNPV